MVDTDVIKQISIKYSALSPYLSEKGRRIWAATEAQSLGYGGISAIATATGISRQTIHSGVHNLEFDPIDNMRNRSPGGGRKSIVEKNPNILYELEKLLEPATRGDPESALRLDMQKYSKPF